MSDLLDKQHYDALMTPLRADAGLTVYPDPEGAVPIIMTPPYVRVWPTIDRPADAAGNSLTQLSTTWVTRWYVHCVGANEYAALALAMRVRAAVLNLRPTIAGRSCGPIYEDAAGIPTRDDTTGLTVWDRTDVYRLMTTG